MSEKPTGPADRWAEERFESEAVMPNWEVRRGIGLPPALPQTGGFAKWQPVLFVSGLFGSLAIVSSLGVWPRLAAARLGLTNRATFHLLAAGLYLATSTLYILFKTAALHNLSQATWDVRLMVVLNLAVSAIIVVVVGIVLLSVVGLVLAVVWPISALVRHADEPSDE